MTLVVERKYMRGSPVERVMARVVETPGPLATPCWIPDLCKSHGGYSRINVGGRAMMAHCFMYEAQVGPIPEGLELDHLCRVRPCIRPTHLEPVTRRENIRRGMALSGLNMAKTHCKRGHPFDEKNTYWIAGKGRNCRACRAIAERDRQRRIRETNQ